MKATLSKVTRLIRRRNGALPPPRPRPGEQEQPLRAELFSADQLRQHAAGLAHNHVLAERHAPDRLLPRLTDNARLLFEAYNQLSLAAEQDRRISPAGEWLLDNFYLVEEHIRMARLHLPRGYSRELPQLRRGPLAGYPRVYELAMEVISHVDGRVDAESLSGFIASYQSVATLALGELWAVPIMLRLALIENLRRVGARVLADTRDQALAQDWAERLARAANRDPSDVVLILAEMLREAPPVTSAFAVEFSRRLQGQSPGLVFPLTWLEQQLTERGVTIDQLVQEDNQQQAADQVSIGNTIASLRFLQAMDWREFVETMSVVERTLREDPADVYNDMDFATRDQYRHAVERIARRSPLTEEQVARRAVQLAREALADPKADSSTAHVGFWLVGEGRARLEKSTGARGTIGGVAARLARHAPLGLYAGSIVLLAVAMLGLLFAWAARLGVGPLGRLALAAPLLVAAWQAALTVVNWLSTLLKEPERLPRLDFAEGIPADYRTMVVVPTLLTSREGVDDLLEALEIRSLANRDEHLHFALLTDFRDAAQESQPEDEQLLAYAQAGVESLNARYAGERDDLFFLFHRPRRWNPHEGIWMGWERKRGKLAEFNALLRGGPSDRFSLIVGRTDILPSVRFVITLDTDTQLPRDSARQLVSTMAHPLNRARYDATAGRVTAGYGILQPRVGVSLPSAARSRYARLFAGEAGIDPYTRTVSDVYQDLFGEGSFIGKGIYDVDAFEQACGGKFPENRILSHDLLEGAYARSGLVTDILLLEEHPSQYSADTRRRHRWIRGDWQIASWLLPLVPGPGGNFTRNPVSWLSQWKILDNLRRSLTPAALVLLLVLSWVVPGFAAAGTLFAAGVVALPAVLAGLSNLLARSADVAWRQHLRGTADTVGTQLAQQGVSLAALPHEAFFWLDAIVRTTVRLTVSRRGLLEWQTASETERSSRSSLGSSYVIMWVCPALGAASLLILPLVRPAALPAAVPLAAAWLLAPALTWWLSRPLRRQQRAVAADDRPFLGEVARRTWRFFETFVGPEDHYLPPDNFQEHPSPVVAHRTSPTNIGLSLLANLAAHDLGYLTAGGVLVRTRQTFNTLIGLERYRGHLYNWYDTRTLRPLPPLYVSSVDSGNLAGHLLTLAQGLAELPDAPVLPVRLFPGLQDTLRIVLNKAGAEGEAASPETVRRLEELARELDRPPVRLGAVRVLLEQLARTAAEARPAEIHEHGDDFLAWLGALSQQARGFLDELNRVAPWTALLPPSEAMWRRGSPEQTAQLDTWRAVYEELDSTPTFRQLAALDSRIAPDGQDAADQAAGSNSGAAERDGDWLIRFRGAVTKAANEARQSITEIATLQEACRELADINFDFLYDKSRRLLTIGYNVTDHRADNSFYDLLASEARLASFVGIAQNKLPQEHWFSLGRPMTSIQGEPAMLSWSGSMFEYLMPVLVMPTYADTLLDQTCRGAVLRQIEYGRQRGVPWGISESAYNTTDVEMNYQYRAFGVPGLGLKRGLGEDVVVAPYASALALLVDPAESTANLRRLAEEGILASFGFYEAIDYTPARVPPGQDRALVKCFMAHHQGMSFLALSSSLLGNLTQQRFMSDPLLKAAGLLLQERIPRSAPVLPHAAEVAAARRSVTDEAPEPALRVFTTPHTPAPEVHLLSNGRYHVMVTAAGGGYSRWRELSVTRWREDAARDCWGSFCYLRDRRTGEVWSTGYQPTLRKGPVYEAIFSQARAEFRRRDGDIETHTDISVSPEDDIELRRITLTNRGPHRRVIELTTFAEVVLAPPGADAAHPAFSNLFVQTELLAERSAILCTRRPRSDTEPRVWMLHLVSTEADVAGETTFETDRRAFIGRGRSLADPAALHVSELSNSHGSVLDPIAAIRRTVLLEPEESVKIDVVTGMADTREGVLALLTKYHDHRLTDRVFELAWTHNQVTLRQLDVSEADAQLYGRLASSILYAGPLRRAAAGLIAQNRRGQTGLWGYGISGDLPIVLVRIGDLNHVELIRQLVRAHAYWRLKGLATDLVIWNEDQTGYRQALHDRIMGVIASSTEAALIDRPGGIFVRRVEQISEEDRILMQTVARAMLSDTAGPLAEQVDRRRRPEPPPPRFIPVRQAGPPGPAPEPPRRNLTFFNGIGGFSRDGREYVINSTRERTTPLPWVNVIANPHFGTVVTDSGGAYTWLENAHEFRLTPWPNDPVTDTGGECLYIRDEETGRFWSPTPLPARGTGPYTTRHGTGYSVFEHTEEGLDSELHTFVAIDAPVKMFLLRLRNAAARPRRISVTGYIEWVLGDLRERGMMHIITDVDDKTGALLARNPYSADFPERIAFFTSSENRRSLTGNRVEFLGRNGSYAQPAAMSHTRLSGRVGAGLDPCAAMQVVLELGADEEREVVFALGAGRDADDVRTLIERFCAPERASEALEVARYAWSHTTEALTVDTPDPSVNLLVNTWLPYQVLSCRYWARSGFYQSGGAFGFRDQLQDVLALLISEPQITRTHLLRCAARQFSEGDVQHWWHPPAGRGVRTHFSDDYLWLPYAASTYVGATGDTGVLDERLPFIEGRALKPEEESYYDLPAVAEESGTLYEHCVRAVRHGLKFGEHGLPLMGAGDWNDGMNLVGEKGRGESVWLAFFLYDVLNRFAPLARARGDGPFADECLAQAARLKQAVEQHAWDGQWYRRAYFDDGRPLGSAGNAECQIDSLPQSWAVLSGAGELARCKTAMEAVDARLVRRDARLIQLFDPPFDRSELNPGYIKGYVPGVRENGGQYTHAAIWTVMAFAALRDAGRAWELFTLINPIAHGGSARSIATYQVEPYVVAADVYMNPQHVGRGGWTWYTGSAGWMYRLLVESLLGLRLEVDRLRFEPVVPGTWPAYTVHYRYRETPHHIMVKNRGGRRVVRVVVDGQEQPDLTVPLVDDRRPHQVEVELA